MEAQSLRAEGDLEGSIALLRVVLSQYNADADRGHLMANNELWRMASYQLALLLLQNSGRSDDQTSEQEADAILEKLGYKLRLSTRAFGYHSCECTPTSRGKSATSDAMNLPLLLKDNVLPQSIFSALKHSLRLTSRYWTEFYSKTTNENGEKRIFASHNLPLPNSTELNCIECIQKANSLIEQVAIIVKHVVSQHFPSISTATSVEVWAHKRTPDAHHQLHYDTDEHRLHRIRQLKGNKKRKYGYEEEEWSKYDTKGLCPIVSCVITINVPNEVKKCVNCGRLGDGAPTLVCDQSLLGSRSNGGWLCYPRQNRLAAFEGSLLHAVVPGIPSDLSEDDDHNTRITFMMGFWKEVSLTAPNQTSKSLTIGPNIPFPSCLLDEFKPLMLDKSILSMHKHTTTKPIPVKPLWVEIKGNCAVKSVKTVTTNDEDFSGRFFLKTTEPTEIDKEVLGL